MPYLVVQPSANFSAKSYEVTSAYNKPRLVVSGSYIPITTDAGSGDCNVKLPVENSTYRLMEYATSSSSSSIQATTGYSGVSSSIQYYQTTSNNSAGLSSTTALTRSSSSGTSALTGAGTQTVYTQAKKSTRTETWNPGSGHCSASFDMSVTASATYLTYSLNQPFIKASGTVSLKYTTSTYSAGPSGMQQTQYTSSYTTAVLNYGSQWLLSTHYSRTFGSYGTVTYSSLYSSIAAATTGTSTLTRSSTSAYAGSSTRQATYLTSSVDQGNMSNTTALTSSESASGSTTSWI